MKKALSLFLAIVMTICAVPAFSTVGVAVEESPLTFEMNSEMTEYIVSGCRADAAGVITIPSFYSGIVVTTIGQSAFKNCTSIVSVIIPDSVNSIELGAFSGCTDLVAISIPESVTAIGDNCFINCAGLVAVQIDNENAAFGSDVFSGCENVTLYSKAASAAALYATANALPFKEPCASHAFSNITYREATCSKLGIALNKCSVCGYLSDVSTTPSPAHTYVDGVCTVCNNWQNKTVAPTIISVTNATTGVAIKWNSLAGATGYIVYRKTASSGWSRVTSKPINALSFTDTKPKSGTTYTYTVKGVHDTVLSAHNTTGVSLLYLATPKVSVSPASNYVKVSWGKIGGAKGYNIYRKAGSAAKWTIIATVNSGSTVSYSDTKVKNGTKYKYTVRAFSGSILSAYNKSGVALTFISAPKITSTSKSGATNTLKWSKVSGATSYVVYRRTINSGWKKLATVKTTSYKDSKASASVIYTYTVRAVKGSLHSGNSVEATPWNMKTKSAVFAFYKNATSGAKNAGPGYKTKFTRNIKDAYYKSHPEYDELFDDVIGEYQDSITFKKGSADAKDYFPKCTLTNQNKISSATAEDKGSYYLIKIKMVTEKNPAKKSNSYYAQVSNLYHTTSELKNNYSTFTPSSISLAQTLTVTAKIYKNGKFHSISHTLKTDYSLTFKADSQKLTLVVKQSENDYFSNFVY